MTSDGVVQPPQRGCSGWVGVLHKRASVINYVSYFINRFLVINVEMLFVTNSENKTDNSLCFHLKQIFRDLIKILDNFCILKLQ